jgi:hypothetical protein
MKRKQSRPKIATIMTPAGAIIVRGRSSEVGQPAFAALAGADLSLMLLFAARELSIRDPRLLVAAGLLAVAFLGGAMVIALYQRWFKALEKSGPSIDEQLSSFRSLYDSGELNQEEYEKVRGRLLNRLKQQVQPAAKTEPAKPDSLPDAKPASDSLTP